VNIREASKNFAGPSTVERDPAQFAGLELDRFEGLGVAPANLRVLQAEKLPVESVSILKAEKIGGRALRLPGGWANGQKGARQECY
jgi:hypothetical protein